MNVLLFIHNITTYCNRQYIELTHINVNYSIPASLTLEDYTALHGDTQRASVDNVVYIVQVYDSQSINW